MNIDDYMLNDNALRKKRVIKEMNEYLADNPNQNSQEYKNKYNHYLAAIASIDNQVEEYMEDEIDVLKYHNSPYLRLKYWISSYTNYYYKILKKEYFVVSKKLKIDININNIDESIKKMENKIYGLKNEEKINYILNINEFINDHLK